jgi:predicted phosphodiesterase
MPTTGRTIVIGDVHGCLRELEALLEVLRPASADSVWFLGDLVDRGPDSAGVVRLVRKMGANLVLGNHDDKHVRFRRYLQRREKEPDFRIPMTPSEHFQEVHRELVDGEIDWLARAPVLARLSDAWVLVHGGLMPGRPLSRPLRPLNLRYLHRRTGRALSLQEANASPAEAVHWSDRFGGPYRVIYGHDAQVEVVERRHTLGIDTGAVYGGRLTAAVLETLERNERPSLVQVRASRAWHEHPRWAGED